MTQSYLLLGLISFTLFDANRILSSPIKWVNFHSCIRPPVKYFRFLSACFFKAAFFLAKQMRLCKINCLLCIKQFFTLHALVTHFIVQCIFDMRQRFLILFFAVQWCRILFRCRIDLLNFSMGFNIVAPYMVCVTHKWISPSLSSGCQRKHEIYFLLPDVVLHAK